MDVTSGKRGAFDEIGLADIACCSKCQKPLPLQNKPDGNEHRAQRSKMNSRTGFAKGYLHSFTHKNNASEKAKSKLISANINFFSKV